MFKKLTHNLQRSEFDSLAKAFSRLGWMGFWMQIILGSVPLVLMVFVFIFARSPAGPRAGLPLVEYLTAASLLILVFTILWFYRYTRFARRIADPATRPPMLSATRTVWTGVVAGGLGIMTSLLLMLIETGNLLFNFLKAPQGGVPVFQTTGAGSMGWVSTIDMASLMALNLFLFAELIVLVFSLWLLFRTAQTYRESSQPSEK
ncbi:MAG: DUF3611 family protein [Candidatus Competibacteraceae bacterium]|nr:MAG: DUF3611 family protein [Candidatus Competibacteraceae bacterium]